MRKNSGFSLVEVIVVIAIMAIVGYLVFDNLGDILPNAKTKQMRAESLGAEGALKAWLGEQKSLASAVSAFQADPSGMMVPKDSVSFATTLQSYMDAKSEPLVGTSDGHLTTQSMTEAGAYMYITWEQPYRSNSPQIKIYIPE
jgi:prepilin-type N-terminal cleavage/methylation domain-containing protein